MATAIRRGGHNLPPPKAEWGAGSRDGRAYRPIATGKRRRATNGDGVEAGRSEA